MTTTKQSLIASIAVLAFVTSMGLASPVHAADDDSSGAMTSQDSTAQDSSTTPAQSGMSDKMDKGDQHVEMRIKSLHSKLKITPDQENSWNAVAQAMRDNEQSIHALIQERHESSQQMTAVDDLKSYEKIADEHADGLKKLIPAFAMLYSSMSDDQKKNADTVFGHFEGHMDHKMHHKMGHKASPDSN